MFRCFRGAIPHLRARGGGRLLATSSVAGATVGWAEHTHYTTAKAGIKGMVRSLALELGPAQITVNAVVPGVIATPQALDPVNSLGPAGVAAFGRADRPQRSARGHRRRLPLPRERRGGLRDGPDLVVDGGVTLQLI